MKGISGVNTCGSFNNPNSLSLPRHSLYISLPISLLSQFIYIKIVIKKEMCKIFKHNSLYIYLPINIFSCSLSFLYCSRSSLSLYLSLSISLSLSLNFSHLHLFLGFPLFPPNSLTLPLIFLSLFLSICLSLSFISLSLYLSLSVFNSLFAILVLCHRKFAWKKKLMLD